MNMHMIVQEVLPKVRLATKDDFEDILAIGMSVLEEHALMKPSEMKVRDWVARAISGIDGVIGVIGDVGHIEGIIHLVVTSFWYTDDAHIEDFYLYVPTEFRKSKNAKALFNFAKNSAIRLGCPLLVGVLSTQDTEQKIRLYERELGKSVGAFFFFNSKAGAEL
jgi:GNAT superfamily N-acetyltransferase